MFLGDSIDHAAKLGYDPKRHLHPELDALIEKIKQEENFDKRNELIEQALLRVNKNIYVLPLHTQVINWALKKNIEAPLRADDRLELDKVIVR